MLKNNFFTFVFKNQIYFLIFFLILSSLYLRSAYLNIPLNQDEAKHVFIFEYFLSESFYDRIKLTFQPTLIHILQGIYIKPFFLNSDYSVRLSNYFLTFLLLILITIFSLKKIKSIPFILITIISYTYLLPLEFSNSWHFRHYTLLSLLSFIFFFYFYEISYLKKINNLNIFLLFLFGFLVLNSHFFTWIYVGIFLLYLPFHFWLKKNFQLAFRYVVLIGIVYIISIVINFEVLENLLFKDYLTQSEKYKPKFDLINFFIKLEINFLKLTFFTFSFNKKISFFLLFLILLFIFIIKFYLLKVNFKKHYFYLSIFFSYILTIFFVMNSSGYTLALRYLTFCSHFLFFGSLIFFKEVYLILSYILRKHIKCSYLNYFMLFMIFIVYIPDIKEFIENQNKRLPKLSKSYNQITNYEKKFRSKLVANSGIKNTAIFLKNNNYSALVVTKHWTHLCYWKLYKQWLLLDEKVELYALNTDLSKGRNHCYIKNLDDPKKFEPKKLQNISNYDYIIFYNYFRNEFLDKDLNKLKEKFDYTNNIQNILIKKKNEKFTPDDLEYIASFLEYN